MKLPECFENKITKNKICKNLPYLEVTEVVLVHSNLLIMIVTKIQELCIDFFQISHLIVF